MFQRLTVFLFILCCLPGRLNAMVVEDFQNFDMGMATVAFPGVDLFINDISGELGNSLNIERDIGIQTVTNIIPECLGGGSIIKTGVEESELRIFFSHNDFSGYKYMFFDYRDLGNESGIGSTALRLALLDGDEQWMHDFESVGAGWQTAVVRLQSYPTEAVGTNFGFFEETECDTFTYKNISPGFSQPGWHTDDEFFGGNMVFNKKSINGMMLKFTDTLHPIQDLFLLDNIRITDDFTRTSVKFFEGYTTYMTQPVTNLSFTFAARMRPYTITSNVHFSNQGGALTASMAYDPDSRTLTLDPSAAMVYDETYSITFSENILFETLAVYALSNEVVDPGLMYTLNYSLEFKSNIRLGADPGTYFDPAAGAAVRLQAGSLAANSGITISKRSEKGVLTNNKIIDVKASYLITPEKDLALDGAVYLDLSSAGISSWRGLSVFHLNNEGEFVKLNARADSEAESIVFNTPRTGEFYIAEVLGDALSEALIQVKDIENNIFSPSGEGVTMAFLIGQGVSQYQMRIYTTGGQEVYYTDGDIMSDELILKWDGLDNAGNPLGDAVYVVDLAVSAKVDREQSSFKHWSTKAGKASSIRVPVILYSGGGN